MTLLTGGSFFSGAIDGLAIAASLVGFDIQFHVEFDDWRRKNLEKHAPALWPNAKQFKDITTLEASSLTRPDVLFGGFPCQDVSRAGSRAGLDESTRSGLWFHFRRLIGDLEPRAVVVENVTGLLSLGGDSVIADLARMGYVGRWGVVSAADAGATQLRERVFIVAYSRQERIRRGRLTEHGSPSVERSEASQRPQYPTQTPGYSQNRLGYRRWFPARKYQRGLGGIAHGFTGRLDFPGFPAPPGAYQHPYEPSRVSQGRVKDRQARIEALGDAVVWQVALPIFYYLHQVLSEGN